MVQIRPHFRPSRSFSSNAWCAQVTVVPEVSRISVLSSGRCHGSNVSIPFGGRPQVATAGPAGTDARTLSIRFDANVTGGLPWRFEPEQNSIQVKLGEVVTVNYVATNLSARETVGQAAYNVAPSTTGAYFQKINCFCFTEQTMGPGEKREMPVVFYVDPALVKDSDNDGLNTITLSYTFYPVRDPSPKPLAAGEADRRKGSL